jgi:hypothetical protein
MDKNIPTTQPTLEEVRDELEHWRKIKRNHREPIPKDLWQAAADLARKHSVKTVSKALRLRYTDLKERVFGRPNPKSKHNKRPSFVEIGCAQPFPGPEAILEMENPKGSRLGICFKGRTDFDFMSLARTFLQEIL